MSPSVPARPDLADAQPHRIEGDFAQALGLDRRGADIEHAAAVAVEAVLDDRDVDVDDVAGLEGLLTGNAVAHDVVDGGAQRRGVGTVARRRVIEGRRNHLLHVDLMIVRDAVELARGDTRAHVRRQKIEQLRCEASGDAHLRDLFLVLYCNRHGIHASHRHARNNSLMLVFERVFASTCFTITAQ